MFPLTIAKKNTNMWDAVSHAQPLSTMLSCLATGDTFEQPYKIHVRALINNSHNKTKKCTIQNYIFYTQFIITPTYFDLFLIIFRELLNINKAYTTTWKDH